MLTTSLDIEHIKEELVPVLRGRAFHLTCLAYVPAILEAARIRVNTDGALATAFGFSKNSFFRARGCVSVFDYRAVTDEELDWSLSRCSPYQALGPCSNALAIFFLNQEASDRLIPWTLSKTESSTQMIMPYVEAGHLGDIPLASIDEMLQVKLPPDDPNSLPAMLRAAREKGTAC